jgi:predicted alpha/beta-fold hydrolase
VSSFQLDTSFRPPRWLRGRHAQTILPSVPPRRARLERRALQLIASSRERLLDCGAGVTLQSFHASPANRGRAPGREVAVLLHGWEGSADSLYILALAQALFENGYEVVRLNLRDHGATHHLNRDLFHSCRLPEVLGAVQRLALQYPGLPLHLIGFSLGGNFMLRVAAHPAAADLPLARVVAISPVLDPATTLTTLERRNRIYHRYFVLKWSRSLEKKQLTWPGVYDFKEFLELKELRAMTRALVLRYTEYPTLEQYLADYAITGRRLTTLAAPATVISALDDPIIEPLDLERVARSEQLEIRVTPHGGHCGFIESLAPNSWIESVVLRELKRPRARPAAVAVP